MRTIQSLGSVGFVVISAFCDNTKKGQYLDDIETTLPVDYDLRKKTTLPVDYDLRKKTVMKIC